MKRIKFLLAAMTLVGALNTFAQESPSRRGLSLSIGPDAALPLGTFRSTSGYKFGIGGSLQLAIPVATNLDVTVGSGYMGFSNSKFSTATNKNAFTIIPFQAGLRVRTANGLYVHPKAGFTQTKVTNQEGSGQFSYALNVGYIVANALDIAVGYNGISARTQNLNGATSGGVSAKFLGLRVAYNIPFARVK